MADKEQEEKEPEQTINLSGVVGHTTDYLARGTKKPK